CSPAGTEKCGIDTEEEACAEERWEVGMTKRILVVEDEQMIATLINRILSKQGYTIQVTNNGAEALRLIEEFAPHLVVLDISLPGMDGYQICRYLRNNPETASLPIIMVTAMSRPSDQRQGFATGADDYLTKPFAPAELVNRIESLFFFAEPM
ncbi:MAG: response regulator, partial [Caldilineaceae bacterium]|nr:response regulator [Caldilineaceae bacterium]